MGLMTLVIYPLLWAGGLVGLGLAIYGGVGFYLARRQTNRFVAACLRTNTRVVNGKWVKR